MSNEVFNGDLISDNVNFCKFTNLFIEYFNGRCFFITKIMILLTLYPPLLNFIPYVKFSVILFTTYSSEILLKLSEVLFFSFIVKNLLTLLNNTSYSSFDKISDDNSSSIIFSEEYLL